MRNLLFIIGAFVLAGVLGVGVTQIIKWNKEEEKEDES